MTNMDAIRAGFPALASLNYLNTGTYGLMAEPAYARYIEALAALEKFGVACPIDLGAAMAEARSVVAGLVGVSADEIAFTRNATDGINLVLAGLPWRPGDEVITTEQEHEAMLHPLLHLQATRQIVVRRVPVSADAATMLAGLSGAASDKTRLVAVSHIPCETGTLLPGRDIATWCRDHGVLCLLDGAQTLGAVPVDIPGLGCDFYAMNGHKWLGGPTGTGMFWARRDRLVDLDPAHVGAGSMEFADATTGEARLWTTGQRFEFGTRAWADPAGLLAAIDWLAGIGWDHVYEHIAGTAEIAMEMLTEIPGVTVLTPRDRGQHGGLVSFSCRGLDAATLGATLRTRYGIHTRHVGHYNATRVATAHFTTRQDLEGLVAALREEMG